MPTKVMFRDLCAALQTSGYDAKTAANLWDRCLQYDREAMEQLKRDSGLYGILHLSQFFEPIDDGKFSEQTPSSKRKGATKSKKPGSSR